jgi:ribosomal protein S18 acetylase RimI-like enzyme
VDGGEMDVGSIYPEGYSMRKTGYDFRAGENPMNDNEPVLEIVPVNYADPRHATCLVQLLDGYARDPMGGGTPLAESVKAQLVPALARCPSALSLLAFYGDDAVGLVNGFETVATFTARPLLNIHDIVVSPQWRRRGIARRLLEAVEELARERGCCKLTLEVLEGNRGAQRLYEEFGFSGYSLQSEFGCALFWQKKLPA